MLNGSFMKVLVVYECLNPSTRSPLQRSRKGGAVSGLACSKEPCWWASRDGALRDPFLQSSASHVIPGSLLFPGPELIKLSGEPFSA